MVNFKGLTVVDYRTRKNLKYEGLVEHQKSLGLIYITLKVATQNFDIFIKKSISGDFFF